MYIQRKDRDHTAYSMSKIGWNTEKGPGHIKIYCHSDSSEKPPDDSQEM